MSIVQENMSSHHTERLDCYGHACRNCGKCRDWQWQQGGCGFCGIGATKSGWKRRGKNCRYGDGDVYHSTIRDGLHHSLCVCERRLK